MKQVGTTLRQAREAAGLTIEGIAAITKVPRASLEAIEAGRTVNLPAPVFVRGFIRSYAQAVGLDSAELMRDLTMDLTPDSLDAPTHAMYRPATPMSESAERFARMLGDGIQDAGPRGRFSAAILVLVAVGMFLAGWLMVGNNTDRGTPTASPGVPVIQQAVDGVSSPARVDAAH